MKKLAIGILTVITIMSCKKEAEKKAKGGIAGVL